MTVSPGETSVTADIINFTPHDVLVRWPGGERSFPTAGVARVADSAGACAEVGGVPIVEVRTGEVSGLPAPRAGRYLLVSRITAMALPERADLLFPFGEIRDERGQIVAVSSLARLAR
ncbi:MAG: hypothetical protein ACOYEV_13295 [Candidatus Nanopelagicales bacterium]